MRKSYFILFLLLLLPISVTAETKGNCEEVVSREIKYYKTVTVYNQDSLFARSSSNSPTSYTEEITKEEYDSVSEDKIPITTQNSVTIETTYKMMVTSILRNGMDYRYQIDLIWKLIPVTRSYDIIGIGHYPSVRVNGNPVFSLRYCTSVSNCTTTHAATRKSFNYGEGASFQLPTGSDITTMQATFYYNVVKNVDLTIIEQNAIGDYSHATKKVTESQAQNYTVSTSGISLGESIISSYDDINKGVAVWTGSW